METVHYVKQLWMALNQLWGDSYRRRSQLGTQKATGATSAVWTCYYKCARIVRRFLFMADMFGIDINDPGIYSYRLCARR